jgi:hypothetical protein
MHIESRIERIMLTLHLEVGVWAGASAAFLSLSKIAIEAKTAHLGPKLETPCQMKDLDRMALLCSGGETDRLYVQAAKI